MIRAGRRAALLHKGIDGGSTLPTVISSRFCICKKYSTSPSAPSEPASPRVIFSGIQPTGKPHLGNYLGALRQWVILQDEEPASTTLLYSIVNLHAFTVRRDAEERRKWQKETFATLMAVGIDLDRAIVFYQSQVREHLTLMWILGCGASIGPLERMTQWKSKTAPSEAGVSPDADWGLFSYPILQAADILLYRATHVPVGHDQAQHLEYARHLAGSFNHRYGDILVPPETIISRAKRIMSLTEPHRKMSKSHADTRSRIYITDTPEEIKRKVRSALTDSIPGVSYDPIARPGVSNLVEIVSHLEETKTCEEVADECRDLDLRTFKVRVTECIVNHLAPIRQRYEEIMANDRAGSRLLDEQAVLGTLEAHRHATATMDLVRDATGYEI